jgi:phosphate starvation-inducible protein PhoH and related proteins
LNEQLVRRVLSFADNRLAQQLYGQYDQNLALIEREAGLRIGSRGNSLELTGGEGAVAHAADVLESLYRRLQQGETVDRSVVRGALKLAAESDAALQGAVDDLTIRTRRRTIQPRTVAQASYLRAIRSNKLTFGLGPAGTGKTYLAVAAAVAAMAAGEVERLVLSRPAVEAGERIGFLPGDMKEKVDPYLRPLYDALYDMLPGDLVARQMEAGIIEIAPLAFMRGRTLAHAFVILDEAQNTSPLQMMMFLTRFGEGARMVVAGDPDQVDLPPGAVSGLTDAAIRLEGVPEIGFQQFTADDVVRDPLVSRIVRAYGSNARAAGRTRAATVAERQERPIDIDIEVECPEWQRQLPDCEQIVRAAATATLTSQAASGRAGRSVAILLADDDTLRELNGRFRQVDKSTNVLAFEGGDNMSPARGQDLHLGDIAVAYQTIEREAREQDKTLSDHLSHMIVHGVLHLLGYDHEDASERKQMEAIERAVLAELGVPDPYDPDTSSPLSAMEDGAP